MEKRVALIYPQHCRLKQVITRLFRDIFVLMYQGTQDSRTCLRVPDRLKMKKRGSSHKPAVESVSEEEGF